MFRITLRHAGFLALWLGLGCAPSGAGAAAAANACTGDPRVVYVVGDSTASVYESNLAPRTGWAQVLGDYLEPRCASVKDMAISGRSSKSFYEEGAWTPVLSALASDDLVLIQFGHNDEKSEDPKRFTEPFTTYQQHLTQYVQDTRGKGAQPILLTSIQRNKWNGGAVSDTHGDYLRAVRELSQTLQVPLIDMAALTKATMDRLGEVESAKLFLILAAGESPNYPTGVTDNTHLHERGARLFAQLVVSDARQQGLALGAWARVAAAAP